MLPQELENPPDGAISAARDEANPSTAHVVAPANCAHGTALDTLNFRRKLRPFLAVDERREKVKHASG